MGRARDPIEPFEPMSMGQALNYGSKIYQRSFIHLMLISVITYVPVALLSLMVIKEATPLGLAIENGRIVASSQATLDRFNQVVLIASLATAVAAIVSMASLHHAIGNAYVRREANWSASIRAALRRAPAVLGVIGILIALLALPVVALATFRPGSDAVVALFLAAFIGMLVMGLTLTPIAVAALLREGLGPVAAVGRAWRLLRSRWISTIALFVVTGFIVGFAFALTRGGLEGGFISGATSIDGLLTGVMLANMLASTLWAPLLVSVMTVAYFDLRVRNDDYQLHDHDLENSANGATRTVPPPLDPATIRIPLAAQARPLPESLPVTLPPDGPGGLRAPLVDTPPRGPRWSQPLPERPHDGNSA